jgi:hypothetical protein
MSHLLKCDIFSLLPFQNVKLNFRKVSNFPKVGEMLKKSILFPSLQVYQCGQQYYPGCENAHKPF